MITFAPEHQSLREAYKAASNTFGEDHPITLTARLNLQKYFLKEGRRLNLSRPFIADCRRTIRNLEAQLAA